jgi:hypothetical protein
MDVEKFVNELTRPLFIWRMARADGYRDTRRQSAMTRRANAEREIERIVKKYATSDTQED